MKKIYLIIMVIICCGFTASVIAEETDVYTVGVDDVLDISILQPEQYSTTVTVAPDGMISFPYVGTLKVKGMTLEEIRTNIQDSLAEGYMKYPVITVFLRESLSRKFFVYGEVVRPGTFRMNDNTTVLKAISIAGGFTKFGSSSRVKVLREKKTETGYETIKVNIKNVMDGESNEDILLEVGDIVVVSEGIF